MLQWTVASDYLVLRFRALTGHFIALFNKNVLRDLRASTLNIKQEQRDKSNFFLRCWVKSYQEKILLIYTCLWFALHSAGVAWFQISDFWANHALSSTCVFARSRWSFIQAVSREMAVFSPSCFVVCEGSSMGCVSALLTNAVRL